MKKDEDARCKMVGGKNTEISYGEEISSTVTSERIRMVRESIFLRICRHEQTGCTPSSPLSFFFIFFMVCWFVCLHFYSGVAPV
jgi:hypothetical protein